MNKKNVWMSAAITAAIAFPAGFAAGNGTINVGLVEALSSVGGNLFGEENFAVSLADVDGASGVQFDLAESVNAEVPAIFNIFPPDPVSPGTCAAAVQVAVTDEAIRIYYDQTVTTKAIQTDTLSAFGHPPDPCKGVVIINPEI